METDNNQQPQPDGQQAEPNQATESDQAHSNENTPPSAPEGGQPAGTSDPKVFGIVGYILPFLFFLPLVNEATKNNPFARYHANQQLSLLLLCLGLFMVNSFLFSMFMPYAMIWLFHMLFQLVWFGVLALSVIGIIRVVNGEMKPLPLIGGFTLLK